MHGRDHKAVLVKGPLGGVPGGEHHEMVGEKLATEVLDIDHYKWTAGSVERARERMRGARRAEMEWAVEYERAVGSTNGTGASPGTRSRPRTQESR